MNAKYCSHILKFKIPGGTSRGVLTEKESFFIAIHNDGKVGLGEVGVLRDLSYDDVPELESQIAWTCNNINLGFEELYVANVQFPSIQSPFIQHQIGKFNNLLVASSLQNCSINRKY